MRQALSCAAALAMIWLSLLGAQTTTTKAPAKSTPKQASKAPQKSSTAKSTAPAKKSTATTATAHKRTGTAAAHKGTASTAARKGTTAHKAAPKRSSVTWRNRQTAPTPDRYREIQSALVSRGYLRQEQVSGTWDQTSIDAMKRFQQEQNIESTGKINSLSLIALGLGPKHDQNTVPPKPGQIDQAGQ